MGVKRSPREVQASKLGLAGAAVELHRFSAHVRWMHQMSVPVLSRSFEDLTVRCLPCRLPCTELSACMELHGHRGPMCDSKVVNFSRLGGAHNVQEL